MGWHTEKFNYETQSSKSSFGITRFNMTMISPRFALEMCLRQLLSSGTWIAIEMQWMSLKIVIGSWSIFGFHTLSLCISTRWKVVCVATKNYRCTQFDYSNILSKFMIIHDAIKGICPPSDIGEVCKRYEYSSNACGKFSGVCNVQGYFTDGL